MSDSDVEAEVLRWYPGSDEEQEDKRAEELFGITVESEDDDA